MLSTTASRFSNQFLCIFCSTLIPVCVSATIFCHRHLIPEMAFGDNHRRAFLMLVALILTMGLAHGMTLEAFPKTLNLSGDNVTLQWKDIPSPSDQDWLGIYSPPDSPHHHFIGYIFLSSCPTWKEGSCSMDLPLINLRSPYEFRVFHLDGNEIGKRTRDHNHPPSDAHLLAKSDTVTFLNLNDPAQLHLAFTSNEDEMRVMFVTKDNIKSYARYGLEKGKLDNLAEAHSLTYKQSDMCDSPANTTLGWRDPGYIHDAVMHGLKPGKRYFYQVGSDEGGWSSIQSFLSPNKNSDETFAFVFGDMGTSFPYRTFRLTQIESKLTVKWLLRDLEELGDKPAFISHIGDLSYARGYAWLWDSFLSQIEPIASKFPYHVCIGNHEYDWPLQPWKPSWASYAYGKDGGGECGVPYSLRFHMPGNSSSSTGNASPVTQNLFYSFDMGVVHFVYISTETNFLQGSDQYAFIEHDLGHVDRSKTPFVVVQGHRPMYTTSARKGDDGIRQKMVEHLEPLFVKFGVNLVLWGHVHSYERLCPLRNSSCGTMDAEGILPIHVVVGMAGAESRPSWKPRSDHLTDPIYPQPPMSIYRSDEFGYTRMHATRSRLTLSYIGNHDGLVHDVLEIGLKETHMKDVGTAFTAWVSFLEAVCLFLVGALLGFIGGCLLYFRRQSPGKVQWTTLSNSEL